MENDFSFYSILNRVDNDGIRRECGYIQKGEISTPVTIIGAQLVKYENIDKARSAFWDGVKRNPK